MPVHRAAARLRQVVRDERIHRARRRPIDDRTVVYESFGGNGMLCNPEAIFRALLAAPDQQHLRHVWALTNPDGSDATVAEFADDPRVEFVNRGSWAYYAALTSARYLVNNAAFPEPFGKRSGQIYLNTWHGTPVKAMGYDVPNGAVRTGNVVRNLAAADYLLAPNADTARMYSTGYRMTNLFAGRMISVGTPRVDRQFADESQRRRIRELLTARGVTLGPDQEIILYAPTWTGQADSPSADLERLRRVVDSVNAGVDRDRYRVLVRVHPLVYAQAAADPRLRAALVPNELPANDVLAVTDALITDYSSIFVDFLATGRPVLFYVPDLDEYASSRGLYLGPDQWPGPLCGTTDELVMHLAKLGGGGADDPIVAYEGAYARARERYCQLEDGNATARVVDIVFRGSTAGYDLRSGGSDGRTPVLIHLGGMRRNGITSAALSLLNNVDHDRFDVSVSYPHEENADQQALVHLIDPRARLFPQSGDVVGGRLRVRLLAAVNGRVPGCRQVLLKRGNAAMRDEWARAFGTGRFAHVIDFSGYWPYWIKLLANRTGGTFAIWLHNDLQAELSNRGRARAVRARLRSAIALYGTADRLVSVSAALNRVNRAALAQVAPAERFTSAMNTIDAERVRRLAAEPAALLGEPAADGERSPDGSGPPPTTFVTAGRLSPEKNHARLIRAFALVHADHPAARLVILGSGPLLNELRELVDELSLHGAVTLAGHQANPYAEMARADCFVLSSDYEGQPMALLESLVLGLPIVTTDFDAVDGALPPGTGRVVAREVDALAEGMRAFLRGEVTSARFDPDAYNRVAMEQFYRAIGAG